MNWKVLIWVLAMILISPVTKAEQAMAHLESFAQSLKTMEAQFTQTLEDANGRQLQKQSGVVKMRKPGQFNWHYQQPYEQTILADGKKLWFYDVDLEQVTVKPLDEALGTAPIALLTSDRPLQEQFTITDLGLQGEQYMLQLESKVKDTDYGYALIVFSQQGMLEAMQLKDPLGQITTITFDDVKMNQALSDSDFTFEVPDGVDVIGM